MNTPLINTNYDKLYDTVRKFGAKYLCFSIFQTIDRMKGYEAETWLIRCVDIESNQPAFNGKCVFTRYDGWPNTISLPVMENPTWKDIILALDKTCMDRDHIFLESIQFIKTQNEINHYFCNFGS